jgi:DNA modification methylase
MDADPKTLELDKDAPRRSMQRLVLPGVELYCGDCADIMPTLQGVDACITDPPYGIGLACAIHCTKPSRPNTYTTAPKYTAKEWDDARPSPAAMAAIVASAPIVVIWGGNYFADMLPPSRGWLYWSKMFENTTNFSHGELAWTSVEMPLAEKRMSSKAETRGGKDRIHPSQKPVGLIAWAMRRAKVPEGATVLDPYMGSGSTIIAAIRTGRKAIGIEKDPEHFKNAVERIKRELSHGDLFLGQNA